MANSFTFGDKSTLDFSVQIERYPAQQTSARKLKTYSIPGRNGDLHAFEGAWENHVQPYSIYFHGTDPAPETAHAIKAWLMRGSGYQRLEDTYDPKYYRKAIFKGPMDIENILNKYGRCIVSFDCAPQYFLVEGEKTIHFSAPGTLHNSTSFGAMPIITVYGTAAGTVTVGGVTVEIKAISDPIILDCETMQAYSQPGEGAPVNQNGNIYALAFPILAPGDNSISFSDGITAVEIVPRWWTL